MHLTDFVALLSAFNCPSRPSSCQADRAHAQSPLLVSYYSVKHTKGAQKGGCLDSTPHHVTIIISSTTSARGILSPDEASSQSALPYDRLGYRLTIFNS